MDAELEFAIQNNTTGKQLFDQVCTVRVFISLNRTCRIPLTYVASLDHLSQAGLTFDMV